MGQRFVQDVRNTNLSMFVTAMYPFVDDEAFCFGGLMGIGGDRNGDGLGDRFNDCETIFCMNMYILFNTILEQMEFL